MDYKTGYSPYLTQKWIAEMCKYQNALIYWSVILGTKTETLDKIAEHIAILDKITLTEALNKYGKAIRHEQIQQRLSNLPALSIIYNIMRKSDKKGGTANGL